jgi:D-glycero-D-manno-heptose 1,7-bisphosphate phosphatase
MQVVFLDRDGVINENRDDHVKSWEEFRFLPGSLEAMELLTRAGLRIFVVTNQACVNRGLISPAELATIHQHMQDAAARAGARIEAVRHCPHRPDEHCRCRKPRPGMLLDLAGAYGLNLERAYMIGDAATDIAAGESAGCQTVLVRTGRGAAQLGALRGNPSHPALVADNLLAAARWICANEDAGVWLARGATWPAPSPQEQRY